MSDPVAVTRLTRRLADTPREFTEDGAALAAVAGDLLLLAGVPDPREAAAVADYRGNQRALALLACWLLADAELLAASDDPAAGVRRVLTGTVPALASVVQAGAVLNDPDRREELARLALRDLRVAPHGESTAEAVDRLSTVDSVRRREVLLAAKLAEERAAAVRKAMEEERAREAAARYSQV